MHISERGNAVRARVKPQWLRRWGAGRRRSAGCQGMHGGLDTANSAARKIPGIPGARNFNRW